MAKTKITIKSNGSIKVSGSNFVIRDMEGREFDLQGKTLISLCRCRHSQNKPFCDGAHREKGFKSEIKAVKNNDINGQEPVRS